MERGTQRNVASASRTPPIKVAPALYLSAKVMRQLHIAQLDYKLLLFVNIQKAASLYLPRLVSARPNRGCCGCGTMVLSLSAEQSRRYPEFFLCTTSKKQKNSPSFSILSHFAKKPQDSSCLVLQRRNGV